MIAIIDYDMGNLRSVQKAFEKIGHAAIVTRDPKTIQDASHVVLPGVGAFPDAMKNLERFKLIDPIVKGIEEGKPFLGLCLGLQLLFTEGEEFGIHRGLDILKGRVVRFQISNNGTKTKLSIPHIGWNTIQMKTQSPLFKDVPNGSYFYFVHSYYVVQEDNRWASTTTEYGLEFTSSIWKDNIFACQFHPEKSQDQGLKLLRRFAEMG
ncbi:MAG TPA: imidazole glycerol phosphate synthase subunit HisH [Nitrospiria bacterium]|jgi:glutamine amidotransferase|nr:imidazole glycerol phosphate synthase subunit HisH [Nitrospiria bacterium]